MATTTNYSWDTPDDTDLVKDGAAAIRTLGSSVDTTVKNLNPETTLGDLAYRSSTANVKTRLGLGTAGQVLQVNSGATAPEWATPSPGGLTLLSTTTLSGASTSITSISQSYTNLHIIATNVYVGVANTMYCRFNADDTAANYNTSAINNNNGSLSGQVDVNNGFIGTAGDQTTNLKLTSWQMQIPRYSFTENHRIYTNFRGDVGTQRMCVSMMAYSSTTAISQLKFAVDGTTFTAGTVYVYGEK
jgi:hypothetical protein